MKYIYVSVFIFMYISGMIHEFMRELPLAQWPMSWLCPSFSRSVGHGNQIQKWKKRYPQFRHSCRLAQSSLVKGYSMMSMNK